MIVFWFWFMACSGSDSVEKQQREILSSQEHMAAKEAFEILEEMRISLAGDSIEGLLERCLRIGSVLSELSAGKEIAKICPVLGRESDITLLRTEYSKIVEQMILFAEMDSQLQEGWSVFSCPMVEHYPKWIQRGEEMENPYMGQAMLACGLPEEWGSQEHQHSQQEQTAIAYYTCPMHPTVQQEVASSVCPICNMDLTPVFTQELNSGAVRIDGLRRQNLSISTSNVQRGNLKSTIELFGHIRPNQHQWHQISLRYSGWIEKVNENAVGSCVERGNVLAEVYSPEVYATQLEFLSSSHAKEVTTRKMKLYGIAPLWISKLIKNNKPEKLVPIYAPVSGCIMDSSVVSGKAFQSGEMLYDIASIENVWVEVEVFPNQGIDVSKGEVYPVIGQGKEAEATVITIEPIQHPLGGTSLLRLQLNNEQGFSLGSPVVLQYHKEVTNVLIIPVDAIMVTGKRRIVFIEEEGDSFRPQEITVDVQNSEFAAVRGLKEGDEVVSSGLFFLAAESRIRSATTYWVGGQDE
jgi:membrane fusion protein, copper/silver efflux system